MPLNDHGWSHPQSIRFMCLWAFYRLCHTWKYCWNLLLGIHYVTLVPCHDCFQGIQYYNVSRKFCQKSLCRKACVGRFSVSIQNRLGIGTFGSLGKNIHLTIGFDVAVTFSLLFTLLLAPEILFLGAFPNCEKWLLPSSCLPFSLSVSPHGATRLLLHGFSWNLIFGYFSKNMPRKFKFHYNMTRLTGTLHEDQYTFFIVSHSFPFRMRNVSFKICREIQNTFFIQYIFFFENHAVYEVKWKNIVEPDRPHMTIWRIHIASWMTKATNTLSEYVICIAFPLQQWLQERASMLHYTYSSVYGWSWISYALVILYYVLSKDVNKFLWVTKTELTNLMFIRPCIIFIVE